MQLWISRLYVTIHSDFNFVFSPVLLYVYYCSVRITLVTEFIKISWVWFLFFTYSTFTVIFCMNYQLQLWISRLTLTLFYLWLLNIATIGGWEEGRYEFGCQMLQKTSTSQYGHKVDEKKEGMYKPLLLNMATRWIRRGIFFT